MRKYLKIASTSFQDSIANRGPTLIFLVGNFIFLSVMIFVVLASSGGQLAGFSKNELVTYYVFSMFLTWAVNWTPFYNLSENIADGAITGIVFVKPVSFYWRYFFNESGWQIFNLIIGVLATVLFGFVFRQYVILSLPGVNLLILLVALIQATMLTFTISMCLAMLAFWFTDVSTVDTLHWAVRGLLGGQTIPLAFLPVFWQGMSNFLPFRYMFSFPLEMYLGKLGNQEIGQGFLIGFTWLLILFGVYRLMWHFGRRAYDAFGN